MPTDPAAVIFTSGSTGPAKGVIYEHGMFNAQVDLIRDRYGIEPGGVDLSGFPLFGLFNAAMGTTTVIPPMNPSKPAKANPPAIVEVIEDQTVTQSFGSPALVGTRGDAIARSISSASARCGGRSRPVRRFPSACSNGSRSARCRTEI